MTGTTQGTASHREARGGRGRSPGQQGQQAMRGGLQTGEGGSFLAAGAETLSGTEPGPPGAVPELACKLELSSVRSSRLKQELFFSPNPFCLFCPASPRPWLPACFCSTPTPSAGGPASPGHPSGTPAPSPAQGTCPKAPLPQDPRLPFTPSTSPSLAQALSQGSPGPLLL